MPAPSIPVTAAELEEALDVLRRAASGFPASSSQARILQTARSVLVDAHRSVTTANRLRLKAERLDDHPA